MQIPHAVTTFNKAIGNPVQSLWAPRLSPWAIVHHKGRKSGRDYSNPVLAFVDGNRVSIVLTYGRNTDWVRNATAAGRFGLTRKSKQYNVTNVRVVPSDSPDAARAARLAGHIFDSVLIGNVSPA